MKRENSFKGRPEGMQRGTVVWPPQLSMRIKNKYSFITMNRRIATWLMSWNAQPFYIWYFTHKICTYILKVTLNEPEISSDVLLTHINIHTHAHAQHLSLIASSTSLITLFSFCHCKVVRLIPAARAISKEC
jgi:hypothetical protein